MCNIIYAPSAKMLDKDDIERSWQRNSHGAGFIARSPEGISMVVKGLMTLDSLMTLLEGVNPESEICLHLRFGTHGSNTPEMTHPFQIRKSLWLMHNGVLSEYTCKHRKSWSDTAIFANDLKKLSIEAIKRLLDTVPGKYCLYSQAEGFELFGGFTNHGGVHHSCYPTKYAGRGSRAYVVEDMDEWDGRGYESTQQDINRVNTQTLLRLEGAEPFDVESGTSILDEIEAINEIGGTAEYPWARGGRRDAD